jgi:hypothetical protein
MAGKVLTEDDFNKGGDPTKEDTSSEKAIPADQKFDQDGKEVIEEPEKIEAPSKEEAKVEPLSKPSDEFKPKHKTWEETEKARLELERGFTEKSMKLSEREKELEKFKKPPEKPVATEDDRIAEITDEALRNINALPADSSTRDRDAAIIWGKAQRKISRLEIDESNRQVSSEREIVTKTYERAQKEGIKTDAELRILGYEFSKTDASLNSDERINQAVESTKGILSQIRDGFVRDLERDKKEKDDLKVLGRGSTRKDKTEEKEERTTMSQQLAQLNEKRKMTKDDLRY